MKIVFGCGGTGGHIYPALALASQFNQSGHTCLFIGNKGGMEAALVKGEGYPFHRIKVQKLSRALHPSLLVFPFRLIASILSCYRYYGKSRPDAVICTGGFVSGPVAIAAVLRQVPLFFRESNSLPGITTKYLARYTRLTFVSWEAAKAHLKGAPVQTAGIPLMPRDSQGRKPDLSALSLDPAKPVILISGGSQGSLMINRAVDQALDRILANGWQLIWQTGKSGFVEISSRHRGKAGIHLFDFSPLLPLFYQVAALAVTRAGAMTIAEQEDNRVPAILIPLPGAAENHQYFNAVEQQRKGVAVCLEQKDLNPDSLIAAIGEVLTHRDTYLRKLERIPPNTASADIRDTIISILSKEINHAR